MGCYFLKNMRYVVILEKGEISVGWVRASLQPTIPGGFIYPLYASMPLS